MTLVINTAHARPDGVHVVNLGTPDETEVSLAPEAEDANAPSLMAWFRDGNKAQSWEPDLADMKAHALDVARNSASAYRRQIAKHAHDDRAIAWALKTPLALLWQMHEGTTDPVIAPLVAEARAGFADEAEPANETPEELRAACIGKWLSFFRATQVVEGMERLAENRIPAAQTPAELQAVIVELQAKEVAATAKLTTLTEGQNNA